MPLPDHFYDEGLVLHTGEPYYEWITNPWQITEDLWARLPDVHRSEDVGDQTWYLKRFIGSGLGTMWTLAMSNARAAEYVPPWIEWQKGEAYFVPDDSIPAEYGGGRYILLPPTTSWLPKVSALAMAGQGITDLGVDGLDAYRWTAMVRGVYLPERLMHQNDFPEITNGVINNSEQIIGTKKAMITWLKNYLTGSKFVEIYHHTNDSSAPYAGDRWDMLIVTKTSETDFDVVEVINDMRLKPAGVSLFHKFVEAADWAVVEGEYTTWDLWDAAGTWDTITTEP